MKIPKFLVDKFGKMWSRVIVIGVILIIAVVGYNMVSRFFTAGIKTEVKLNKNLGKAGIESGRDAVDTVTNRAASDREELDAAQETKDEIRNQADAGGVTRAGRSGLCDRSPNRRGCGGVQRGNSE